MRKAILAGALGVLMGAGMLATQGASAYNGTSCSGANLAGPVYGPGGDELVCANGVGVAGIDGGAITAGVTAANGPTRVCAAGTSVPVNSPVGAYVIVDGDDANAVPNDPFAASDGYIGVSNYETGAGNQNCSQGAGGSGSNSGGSFGVDAVPGATLPLPLACGNTSGDQFGSNGRDGCYVP